MVRIKSVNLHVRDVRRATAFWTAALDYEAPAGDSSDDSPVLTPKDGEAPEIVLDTDDQTHLDLYVADAAEQHAEVDRLVALGASRPDWSHAGDAGHVVLIDPEGNPFCVVISAGRRAPDRGASAAR
jgi:catechol 2,3-dioxygenase-like lactoylglutathione lyase family enzyme